MEDFINEITAISKTLEELNIAPTIYNMDRLLGCQQHLMTMRDKIQKMVEEEKNAETRTE